MLNTAISLTLNYISINMPDTVVLNGMYLCSLRIAFFSYCDLYLDITCKTVYGKDQ